VRRLLLLRQQSGELVGVGVAGNHSGEELLAALEKGGMFLGLGAHRRDVGLHPGQPALHLRHIAVHQRRGLVRREARPGQQQKGGHGGRHLDPRADREAAQALAVVKKNITRLEQVAEPVGHADVRPWRKICHHLPRSTQPRIGQTARRRSPDKKSGLLPRL
jgi:hypothetical protein